MIKSLKFGLLLSGQFFGKNINEIRNKFQTEKY